MRKRDSVRRIREKRKQIEACIRAFDAYEPDCAGAYINVPCLSNAIKSYSTDEQYRSYVQLKMQLLVFYSIVKSLGAPQKVLNDILDSVEVCLRGDAEESNAECYSLGFLVSPFWNVSVEPGAYIFTEESCAVTQYESDEDDESCEESVSGFINPNLLECFVELIREVPTLYEPDEIECFLKYSDEFYSLVSEEELYYDETVSQLFFVHSQLLNYFVNYRDMLSVADRRAFDSHKTVKKINDLLEHISYFSPGKVLNGKCGAVPDVFLYCIYDIADGYSMQCNCSQLYADFMVGLRANLLDLLIFELDEEFHFLPKMYAGRSNEIFPEFVSKSERLKKETAVLAV